MSNALASIALTFPDCVNRGDDPCDAWRHMAEQWRLATAQYDELQKREQALRARLDICHDEDGGVHDEIDRLKAALLNAEFDNERLEEERAKFAGLYAAESHKGARLLESLEAKLEQSEHNCDMLLRYIDQALRDARQLQASLDDWKTEIPQDADTHRFRSTRAYQIVKGLETASHSRSPDSGVPAPEQIGAPSMSAGRSTPAQPTPRCLEAWHDLGFTWRCVLPADHAGKHKMEQER